MSKMGGEVILLPSIEIIHTRPFSPFWNEVLWQSKVKPSGTVREKTQVNLNYTNIALATFNITEVIIKT